MLINSYINPKDSKFEVILIYAHCYFFLIFVLIFLIFISHFCGLYKKIIYMKYICHHCNYETDSLFNYECHKNTKITL